MRRPNYWGAVCVAGALLAGSAAVVSKRTADGWKELKAEVAALPSVEEKQSVHRPSLYGPSIPGRAFDHYILTAGSGWRDMNTRWMEVLAAFTHGVPNARELRARLVQDYEEELQSLHLGAHSSDPRPRSGTGSWSGSVPKCFEYRPVVMIGLQAIELDLEEGRPQQGAERLMDIWQMGRDLFDSEHSLESFTGCALLAIGTFESFLIEWPSRGALLDSMPPKQLRQLERVLAELDENFPDVVHRSKRELILFVNSADRDTYFPGGFPAQGANVLGALTLGLSEKVDALQWGREFRRVHALRTEAGSKSWNDWLALYEEAKAPDSEFNRICEDGPMELQESYEKAWRGTLAYLRLTRAAIGYRLRGVVEPMEDPFGGVLQVSHGEEGLTLQFLGSGDERLARRYSTTLEI